MIFGHRDAVRFGNCLDLRDVHLQGLGLAGLRQDEVAPSDANLVVLVNVAPSDRLLDVIRRKPHRARPEMDSLN